MADAPQMVETTETIDPTATGTQTTKTQDPSGETPAPKFTDWDALVKAHPEASELFEGKTKGLKSALEKERDAASDAAKDLRKLAKEADEKTAAALNKLADEKDAEIAEARKESAFYRDAAAAGIPGDKLARAWLFARNADYFDKRGNPDIQALKTEMPELFTQPAQPAPRVNAGQGTQQPPAAAHDFDSNVRKRLGST
jgi:hypothetical protein